MGRSTNYRIAMAAVVAVLSVMLWGGGAATTQAAGGTSAVYTTDEDCAAVNLNHYSSKAEVFVNGGPSGPSGKTKLADGEYYVQVTAPGGTVLGTSIGAADETPIHVSGGRFAECYQLLSILVRASDGQPGYDDTTNNGGVYKVAVCESQTFKSNTCKKDSFKVRASLPTVSDCTGAAKKNKNRTIIDFNVLLSRQTVQRSATIPVNIPAGTYDVTLASFDDHVAHPGQNQLLERWHAEFVTADGLVKSANISDLPEEPTVRLVEKVGQVTFTANATGVSAVHMLEGQPASAWQNRAQSVYPLCVALDRVKKPR